MRNILLVTSLEKRLPGSYYTAAALSNALEVKITLLYVSSSRVNHDIGTDQYRRRIIDRHEDHVTSRLSLEASDLKEIIGKMIGKERKPIVDYCYLKSNEGDVQPAIIHLKPFLLLLETAQYHLLHPYLAGNRALPVRISFPILIIPERQKLTRVRAFNFATDLDAGDLPVIKELLQLTTYLNAFLRVYHVSRKVFIPDFREEENIADFRHGLHEIGKAISFAILMGEPVDKLLTAIDTTGNDDILVLVQRLHSFTWYLFHDSITEKAVIAYCPVLLLPETYRFY